MPNPLLIVHGWSASSQSFDKIQAFLMEQKLYQEIKLIDYKSLDDQVSLDDFADKFEEQFKRLFPDQRRVDVLCHSTGSLIVRAWLALRRRRQKRNKQPLDMPVQRLFMFAPANFGSDLALLGQSGLHRLRTLLPILRNKTLNSDTLTDPGEVGKKLLQALEPASPDQWKLSHIDLHEEDYFGHNPDPVLTCYPFVFAAGSFKQNNGLSRIIPSAVKPGTDSTVRICGTSLNTRKLVVRLEIDTKAQGSFAGDKTQSLKTRAEWAPERKFPTIAFAVFPEYNHGSVVQEGLSAQGNPDLSALFQAATQVSTHQSYGELVEKFKAVDQKNQEANADPDTKAIYQQFFFTFKDDIDNKLDSYFIDFEVVDSMKNIHTELTDKCREKFNTDNTWYPHSADSAFRTLMLDYRQLADFFEEVQQKDCKVKMVITMPQVSDEISFVEGKFTIFPLPEQFPRFLSPNVTTLVEIILDRKQKDTILSIR
jgi:hypothetical protein